VRQISNRPNPAGGALFGARNWRTIPRPLTAHRARFRSTKRLSSANGPNPRPACHAEGRGFESHHPLLKSLLRTLFCCLGVERVWAASAIFCPNERPSGSQGRAVEDCDAAADAGISTVRVSASASRPFVALPPLGRVGRARGRRLAHAGEGRGLTCCDHYRRSSPRFGCGRPTADLRRARVPGAAASIRVPSTKLQEPADRLVESSAASRRRVWKVRSQSSFASSCSSQRCVASASRWSERARARI
jgi:hypothetical protein